MDFAQERYSDELVAEMMPLWEIHSNETRDMNPIPLDPNLEVYKAMDMMGMLRVYTMRFAKKLVGYQVMMVSQHHHSKDLKVAQMDILFVHPDWRLGLIAYRFIKWCDAKLAAEGVQLTVKAIKARLDFGTILERMDYVLEDVVYSRRLSCP